MMRMLVERDLIPTLLNLVWLEVVASTVDDMPLDLQKDETVEECVQDEEERTLTDEEVADLVANLDFMD